jgi:hypothetical protein
MRQCPCLADGGLVYDLESPQPSAGRLLIAMDPDKSKPAHWWNLVAVGGGLIAAAAVPVQFVAAFLIGLGLLSFGVGEWVNHAQQTETARSKIVSIHTRTRGNPWRPKVHGILLDALGVGLLGLGILRLFAVSLVP